MIKYSRKNMFIIIALLIVSFLFVIGSGMLEAREGMENIVKDVDIKKNQEKIDEKTGEKPQRFMYMSSGIKRNSSYDSRGEPAKMKFEPEKTGAFYNSVLNNNYTAAI